MRAQETRSQTTDPHYLALFDEDGFLVDPDLWSTGMAQTIAEELGLGPLSSAHWRLLHEVRTRFQQLGGPPSMRRVCRAAGLSRSAVYELFGGCLPAWRIAGLPNPGEEAKAYLG